MSIPALLRFVAAYTTDPNHAQPLMVQRGALETIGRDGRIPVLVDHDPNREVGYVRETFVAPDYQGGDWYWASVVLTHPPGWLKPNGGVSWAYNKLMEQDLEGTTRLLRGLIREISILSPTVEPAEPRARVEWIGEPETGEQVIHHPPGGTKLVRHGIGQVLGVR